MTTILLQVLPEGVGKFRRHEFKERKMDVLPKVLGMTVAGVLVIVLYLCGPVLGALFGAASPANVLIYVGLALSALWLSLIMYLTTTGGGAEG
jgi:hypothetical protein